MMIRILPGKNVKCYPEGKEEDFHRWARCGAEKLGKRASVVIFLFRKRPFFVIFPCDHTRFRVSLRGAKSLRDKKR